VLTEFFHLALFAIFSICIAGADIKTGAIPRIVFAIAFPFFFLYNRLLASGNPLRESAIGMLLGLAIFLLAFLISKGKLGLADVWYSALIGMLLGPRQWYAAICTACLTAAICMLVLRKRQVPFIPFMAFGSIIAGLIQVYRYWYFKHG